jgi:hypothetical protein
MYPCNRHGEATRECHVEGGLERRQGGVGWRASALPLLGGFLVGPRVWLCHGLAQICKVCGPFLYLIEWSCITLSLVAHFDCISMFFIYFYLHMINHQNLWNVLVYKLYY